MKLKNWKKNDRNDLKCGTDKYVVNDFQQFQTIRSFGDSIFNGTVKIGTTDKKIRQSIRKYFRISE